MSTLSPDRREIVPDALQAVQPLPELQEDVVYCNVCNVDGDKETGILKGTVEDALSKGWSDENWGLTCGSCRDELQRIEEDTIESGGLRVIANFIKV